MLGASILATGSFLFRPGWEKADCMNLYLLVIIFNLKSVKKMNVLYLPEPANIGDGRDAVSTLGPGRSPGVGKTNSLRYSCPENTMDRGTLQATIHRNTKSQT